VHDIFTLDTNPKLRAAVITANEKSTLDISERLGYNNIREDGELD